MDIYENNITQDIDETLVEERLDKDLKQYNKLQKIYAIVGIILLLFTFKDPIIFRIKFSFAVPTKYEVTPINVKDEPLQVNYPLLIQAQNSFNYTSLINGHEFKIIPQAYYKLSGLVLAHNHTFFFKNDFFDSAALYDIGVGWGAFSNKRLVKKYLKSYSDKNEVTQARVLYVRYKSPQAGRAFAKESGKKLRSIEDFEYSHSHLVPANRNVMAALLKIRNYQKVEIEGQLIDMEYINKLGRKEFYRTSTVRTDPYEGNRGYGSCETIYVKRVRIENKVYE